MKSYTLPYYITVVFFSIFIFTAIESVIHGFTPGDLIALGLTFTVAAFFYNDYRRYKREYMLRESRYKRLVEKLEKELRDDSGRKTSL